VIGALVALALTPALADDLFTIQDPAITESSAVVEVGQGPDRRVLTVHDSGHGPVGYVPAPRTPAAAGNRRTQVAARHANR